MLLAMILLQTVAPQPDISFNAHVEARSVTVEKRGDASLTVTASPDAGSVVKVEAPETNGRRRLRNVDIDISAEARIADPLAASAEIEADAETVSPE